MFGNVVAMAERRLALGKCLTLYAHNVERKHKFRSNRVTIVRFYAGIASLPTAAKLAATLFFAQLDSYMLILSGQQCPDFLWRRLFLDSRDMAAIL